MMNKIAVIPESGDVDAEDEISKAASSLATSGEDRQKIEERIVGRYLLRLRHEFTNNAVIVETLKNAEDLQSIKEYLLQELKIEPLGGTEGFLAKALDLILQELQIQRNSLPSEYLIDKDTGKAIMAITPDMVYQPPDYVGEDGLVHKARPILHPKISSGLAMRTQETERNSALFKRASESPLHAMALTHITDPDSMLRMAEERLAKHGFVVGDVPDHAQSEEFEFGSEMIDAEFQSLNPSFHRACSYAAILATKIAKKFPMSGEIKMGPAQLKKTAKQRWYVVSVKFRPHPASA